MKYSSREALNLDRLRLRFPNATWSERNGWFYGRIDDLPIQLILYPVALRNLEGAWRAGVAIQFPQDGVEPAGWGADHTDPLKAMSDAMSAAENQLSAFLVGLRRIS